MDEQIDRLKEAPSYLEKKAELEGANPDRWAAGFKPPVTEQQLLLWGERQEHHLDRRQYREVFLPPWEANYRPESPLALYVWSTLLYNQGIAYDYLGKFDSALAVHHRALDLRKEVLGPHHQATAGSYGYLGYLYRYEKNDLRQAEDYYRLQLKSLQAIGGQATRLARCYYNLSSTYGEKQDYSLALTYAFKALAIAREESMEPSFITFCLTSIANNYELTDRFKEAIRYYEEAIEILEEEAGAGHPALVLRLNNLGVAYQETGRYQEAEACFQRSVAIARKEYGPGSEEVANSYMLLGLHRLETPEGKVMVEDALQVYRNRCEGPCKNVALAYKRIGRWWENQGQPDSTLAYYHKALQTEPGQWPESSTLQEQPHLLRILLAWAKVHQVLGDTLQPEFHLNQALQAYGLMDEVLTLHRLSFQREGSKLFHQQHYKVWYERAIRCALDLYTLKEEVYYLERLWYFMERSKAGILLETIAELQARQRLGMPEALQKEEGRLKSTLAKEYTALAEATDETREEIQSRIFKLTEQQDSLMALIRKEYPGDYRYRNPIEVPALKEVQQYLGAQNATLLEYFYGEEAVYALVVQAGGIDVYSIGKAGELQRQIMTHTRNLEKGFVYTSRESDFKNYLKSATGLYDTLVAPLRRSISTPKLVVIPDGPLAFVSFETLLPEVAVPKEVNYRELPYLLKDYTFAYHYSAGLLLHSPGQALSLRDRPLLAFAYTGQSVEYTSLPHSVAEVRALQKNLPDVQAYWDSSSTKARFKARQAEAGILHLALHYLNDTVQPYQSGLLFPAAGTGEEDACLRLYELYELSFHAGLVVLSACESGTGKLYKGEGSYSLGRAFTYSGIPCVVTSLWQVSDTKTAGLMTAFYTTLYEGHPVVQALTQAKRDYLQQADKFNAHPAYWGAFIAMGNATPEGSGRSSPWVWVGWIVLTLLGLVAYYRYRSKA